MELVSPRERQFRNWFNTFKVNNPTVSFSGLSSFTSWFVESKTCRHVVSLGDVLKHWGYLLYSEKILVELRH